MLKRWISHLSRRPLGTINVSLSTSSFDTPTIVPQKKCSGYASALRASYQQANFAAFFCHEAVHNAVSANGNSRKRWRQMRRRRSLVIHSRYCDRQHRNGGQWPPLADIISAAHRQSSFARARRKTMQPRQPNARALGHRARRHIARFGIAGSRRPACFYDFTQSRFVDDEDCVAFSG